MRLAACLPSLALALSVATASAAGLGEDLRVLTQDWKKLGEVTRLEPRLYERAEVRPLLLSPELTNPATDTCTTVILLSAPSVHFVARFLPLASGPRFGDRELPEPSVAGAVQLVRCGMRKAMLDRLVLEMRSPRAVVEVLVVSAPRPMPLMTASLPHRDPGPSAPPGRLGGEPVAASVDARVGSLTARLKREGAEDVSQRVGRSNRNGAGQSLLRVPVGCQRLHVLGRPAGEQDPRGVDVDAEIVLMPSGQRLADDRTESLDASLEFCVGQPSAARLMWIGAAPGSEVTLVSGRFALPPGLPEHWGTEPRARMAEVLSPQQRRALASPPVHQSLGVSGVTLVPIEVEPRQCYLAAIAAIRGESSGIAMAAQTGGHTSQNQSGAGVRGTVLTFCSRREARARIEVEARGSGVAWLLGIWKAGRLPLSEVSR